MLEVGSSPTLPVTLKVGDVNEQIQVEATTSEVETRDLGVGTVIETQRILDLPLNGRQPTDLITLSGLAVQTGSSPITPWPPASTSVWPAAPAIVFNTTWTEHRTWILMWARTCLFLSRTRCRNSSWPPARRMPRKAAATREPRWMP